jgi:hypothetical protein
MAQSYLTGLVSGYEVPSRSISFAFSDSYYGWSSFEKAQFRAGLDTWSNVASVRFVETGNEAQADDFILLSALQSGPSIATL